MVDVTRHTFKWPFTRTRSLRQIDETKSAETHDERQIDFGPALSPENVAVEPSNSPAWLMTPKKVSPQIEQPQSDKPGSVLYLDATNFDGYVADNARRLAQKLDGQCSIVVGINGTAEQTDSGVQLVTLSDDDIFSAISHSKDFSKGIIPGNPDLKLLAAIKSLPPFDVLLRVEYDVLFVEDPASTIEDLLAACRNADFTASYISSRDSSNSDWMWWDSLIAPSYLGSDVAAYETKAFLPVMGLSSHFINVYKFALMSGWKGHYEVLMPSVAKYYGLTFLDLSKGHNSFTSFPCFGAHTLEDYPADLPRIVHPIKDAITRQRVLARS